MSDRILNSLQIGNDWFGERQGGLNRVFSELLKYLPTVGVSVRGLVAGNPSILAETGGSVIPFAPRTAPLPIRLVKVRRCARRVLRTEAPDLLVSHFALYGFSLVDLMRRIPTTIHFQGPWAAESGVEGDSSLGSKTKALIETVVYRRAQRFIVLSRAFQEELSRRYRVPEEKIRVVPAGVDLERFNDRLSRAEARQQLGWPTDRPIVLSIRRQVRRMGLENLVDAVSIMQKRIPDALVLLGGTGPLARELAVRISNRGLDNNVRQLGRITDADLPVAYRAADLSIVPTQYLEGFGLITIESLASGTPVLVTPIGGLPEIVRPLAPQCVLEDARTDTIADTLGSCLLGARPLPASSDCRQYAIDCFSWPVIARRVRDVYEEALLNGPTD